MFLLICSQNLRLPVKGVEDKAALIQQLSQTLPKVSLEGRETANSGAEGQESAYLWTYPDTTRKCKGPREGQDWDLSPTSTGLQQLYFSKDPEHGREDSWHPAHRPGRFCDQPTASQLQAHGRTATGVQAGCSNPKALALVITLSIFPTKQEVADLVLCNGRSQTRAVCWVSLQSSCTMGGDPSPSEARRKGWVALFFWNCILPTLLPSSSPKPQKQQVGSHPWNFFLSNSTSRAFIKVMLNKIRLQII